MSSSARSSSRSGRSPPFVIKATLINGREIVLNADLIASIELTPETLIVLANANRFMVQETVDEIVERVISYHRQISGFTIWHRGQAASLDTPCVEELDREEGAEVPDYHDRDHHVEEG